MELREYWHILRRRWVIPAALVLLVAVLSAVQLRPWEARPVGYNASMRFLVGVLPAAEADGAAYDPRYYAWLTSEYLVDDFTEVVRSDLFARNVSERLAGPEGSPAITVPPGAIQGSAATGRLHRIISLSIGWANREELVAIAEAAGAELTENAGFYFEQLGTEGAGVTLLDPPAIGEVGPGLRERLEWPLRVGLALAVGVGLALFLDYMDTSVRGRRDVEELGLRVIGEIPKER